MTIKRKLKQGLKSVLVVPAINQLVRAIAKAPGVRSLLPLSFVSRIPVVGDIKVQLPNGNTLKIANDGNDTISARLFWIGLDSFEPETVGLLYKILPRVRTFFDIGANSGFLSLLAGADDRSRQVRSFEPVPSIVKTLERNIRANKMANVRAEAMAITDFDGTVDMYIPMDVYHPLGSSLVAGYREASQVIRVPAMTLDSYVAANNINKVDLLKIDTETTEPRVLAGALKTIKRDQPLIICEVQAGKTEPDLEKIMAGLGYNYYHVGKQGLKRKDKIAGDPTGEDLNYLFVPSQLTAELASVLNGK